MQKKHKKILFFATAFTLTTSSISVTICKEQSNKFTTKVLSETCSNKEDNILIASHRGFSSLAVENTKQAITLAASKSYIDYIEMDARLTKDKKIVLAHNDDLKMNNYNKLTISKTDYETIKNSTFLYESNPFLQNIKTLFNTTTGELLRTRITKLNKTPYKLASLKDGLKACGDKKIFLDLKFNNNTKDFITTLTAELDTIDKSKIIFQSSDLISLLYLQTLYPDYNCLALIRKEEELDYVPLFNNLGIRKNLIDKDIVKKAIKDGKNVSVWTLNDPTDLESIWNELESSSQQVIYVTDVPDMVDGFSHNKQKQMKKATAQ